MLKNNRLLLLIILVIIFGGIFFSVIQKKTEPSLNHPVMNTPKATPSPILLSPTPIPSKSFATLNYINTVDWPPTVKTDNSPYSCMKAGDENSRAGKTQERTVDGQKYCITAVSEGAAGSVYVQYTYTTATKEMTPRIITFSIRMVQCGNYPEPKMSECKTEQNSFDIDEYVTKELQEINK